MTSLKALEDCLANMNRDASEAQMALRAVSEDIAGLRRAMALLHGELRDKGDGAYQLIRPLREAIAQLDGPTHETLSGSRTLLDQLSEACRASRALSDTIRSGSCPSSARRSWRQSVADAISAANRPLRAQEVIDRVASLRGTARNDESFSSLQACVRATLNQFRNQEIAPGTTLVHHMGANGEARTYALLPPASDLA